jgi:hypothetical protein
MNLKASLVLLLLPDIEAEEDRALEVSVSPGFTPAGRAPVKPNAWKKGES